MLEPTDAKDLVDEAIERAETERSATASIEQAGERRFRDRVSLLVVVLSVSLAIVHMAAAGAARESLLKGIKASDTFNYMQAKIVRETIFKVAAKITTVGETDRQVWMAEAKRLREPDPAGHGIGQLEAAGKRQRDEGGHAATAVEGYELGETALQMAIVLLSIALVARSRPIVGGAVVLAIAGIVVAAGTAAGMVLPWV